VQLSGDADQQGRLSPVPNRFNLNRLGTTLSWRLLRISAFQKYKRCKFLVSPQFPQKMTDCISSSEGLFIIDALWWRFCKNSFF
jgi:hypothetical protein